MMIAYKSNHNCQASSGSWVIGPAHAVVWSRKYLLVTL